MHKRLKDVRRERGLSQGLLAAGAKMSASLLCYAEGGRFRLSAGQAKRIAAALGVEPGDVLELRDAIASSSHQGTSACDSAGDADGRLARGWPR